MKQVNLGVVKLDNKAIIPQFAHGDEDFCFDLHIHSIRVDHQQDLPTAYIGTGLKFEIPKGWGLCVFSRSGHGFKQNIRLANGTAIIDSGYKGEVLLKLVADSSSGGAFFESLRVGDRIAQATLIERPAINIMEIDSLTDSNRGDAGIGSTGH